MEQTSGKMHPTPNNVLDQSATSAVLAEALSGLDQGKPDSVASFEFKKPANKKQKVTTKGKDKAANKDQGFRIPLLSTAANRSGSTPNGTLNQTGSTPIPESAGPSGTQGTAKGAEEKKSATNQPLFGPMQRATPHNPRCAVNNRRPEQIISAVTHGDNGGCYYFVRWDTRPEPTYGYIAGNRLNAVHPSLVAEYHRDIHRTWSNPS